MSQRAGNLRRSDGQRHAAEQGHHHAETGGELSFVGRKVIDRTGLSGAFDVSVEWMPDDPGGGAPPPDNLPSIFTAIQEQLGLKLEPATGPVDFVTIVRAERPTPN